MYNDHNSADAIDYTPVEPAVGTNKGNTFSFSLVAMGAGQPVKYWAVPPTGFADTDYQLGRNFGDEVVRAAADKPKLIAVMLSKAMMALPEASGEYAQMLRGLFDRVTEELAKSAAFDDAATHETIEIGTPPGWPEKQ